MAPHIYSSTVVEHKYNSSDSTQLRPEVLIVSFTPGDFVTFQQSIHKKMCL